MCVCVCVETALIACSAQTCYTNLGRSRYSMLINMERWIIVDLRSVLVSNYLAPLSSWFCCAARLKCKKLIYEMERVKREQCGGAPNSNRVYWFRTLLQLSESVAEIVRKFVFIFEIRLRQKSCVRTVKTQRSACFYTFLIVRRFLQIIDRRYVNVELFVKYFLSFIAVVYRLVRELIFATPASSSSPTSSNPHGESDKNRCADKKWK